VHAEHITSEENARLAVQSEHGVRPVQIGSHHELQDMPLSKVQRISSLHLIPHQKIRYKLKKCIIYWKKTYQIWSLPDLVPKQLTIYVSKIHTTPYSLKMAEFHEIGGQSKG